MVTEAGASSRVIYDYCTDATNPAMGIAESDDKRPANPAMTDDCRVDHS